MVQVLVVFEMGGQSHPVWARTDLYRRANLSNAVLDGANLSRAQLSMLLEGIDWRMPQRTWRPELAG